LAKRDILSVADLTPGEVEQLVKQAVKSKKESWPQALAGKNIALLFEKPSLRTRMSFELAASRLSADTILFTAKGSSVTKGETTLDTARIIAPAEIPFGLRIIDRIVNF